MIRFLFKLAFLLAAWWMARLSLWKVIVPEETINLITNPSFETGTDGWITAGSNTIAQSSARSFSGAHSLLCTYQVSTSLAVKQSVTITSTAHTMTAWVYLPLDWDGGVLRLHINGFVGAVVSAQTTTSVTGEWVKLETTFTPDAGDLTGQVFLQALGAPTAGRTVYLDAFQLERKEYATTYCDGDQDGCYWLGTPHASKSARLALDARGGRVLDFEDDLDAPVRTQSGFGAPPVQNRQQPLALYPGTLHDGQNLDARVGTLGLDLGVEGDDLADLHGKRLALLKALNSRVRKVGDQEQPRRFRYTGTAEERELAAVYDSGLELSRNQRDTGFTEAPALRLRMDDPLTYSVQEYGAVLDAADSLSLKLAAARVDGRWSALGPPDAAGTYTAIYAMAVGPDGKIYVGGNFLNFDGNSGADYIARYDPDEETWEQLSATGANNIVEALTFGPDGTLYVGGSFTSIGGVAAKRVATYDVDAGTFAEAGNGLNGAVSALAWVGGQLYAGGAFTQDGGGGSAPYIAVLNTAGTDWDMAGANGVNNNVYALQGTPDGLLYAGGIFTQNNAGTETIEGVAVLDTTESSPSWAPLTSPGGSRYDFNNAVRAFALSPDGVDLYIGGNFTAPGNSPGLVRWNGYQVVDVGTGLKGVGAAAYALATLSDGRLLVGGGFTGAGDVGAGDFVIWNGSTFAPPDIDMEVSGTVRALATTAQDDVYLGGTYTTSVQVAGITTVAYSGGEPARPTITIKRTGGSSATLRYLGNETTGAALHFDLDLLDGETITIRLAPREIEAVSDWRGRLWHEVRQDSQIESFFLAPGHYGDRDNEISLLIVSSGSPTLDCRLRYRNTYMGVD